MDYELVQKWQLLGAGVLLALQLFLTLKRPAWAAALIAALLPTYLLRIRFAPLPTNVLELLVWSFFIGYIFLLTRRRARLPELKNSFWAGMGLLFFGATISAAVNAAGADAELQRTILGSWKGNMLDPALFLVALSGLIEKEKVAVAVRAYIAGAVIVAAVAVILGALQKLSLITGISAITYDGRLRGFHLSPNYLAMYVTPALVLTLALAHGAWQIGSSPRRKESIHYALFTICLSAALFWTGSLGALIGLASGLIAYGLWHMARRRTNRMLAIRYVLFAICLLGLLTPFLAISFSSHLVADGERSSLASRIMIWRSAENMLSQHWLLGIGPGAFQEQYLALQKNHPLYLEWAVPQPHNLFLSIWLQGGILGLFGFLWILFAAFRRVLAPNRYTLSPVTIAAASALTAIVFYGFVDTPFWKSDLTILLFLTAAYYTLGEEKTQQAK